MRLAKDKRPCSTRPAVFWTVLVSESCSDLTNRSISVCATRATRSLVASAVFAMNCVSSARSAASSRTERSAADSAGGHSAGTRTWRVRSSSRDRVASSARARSPCTKARAKVTRMPTRLAPNVTSSPASGPASALSVVICSSARSGATPRSVSIKPAKVPTSPTSTVTATRYLPR